MGSAGRVFRFGVFELDAQSGELRRHGQKVRLPDQAFQVLQVLLNRPGELVTRDELRSRLWKPGTFVGFDVGLNSAVRKLRDALDDSSADPQLIETLPRRGYRFIASVEVVEPSPSQPAPPVTSLPVRRSKVAAASALALAVLVVALGIASGRGWRPRGEPATDVRSLAVLPFDNLTGDATKQYLAEAITDALTTRLAQLDPMNVISRASAARLKGANKPEADGRDLKVDVFVEGAVVRAGHQVRVSAQVVDASTDRHIWAASFDGELGDILALQQRIAEAVAAALGRRLPPDLNGSRSRHVDPAAEDAYLKGIFTAGQITVERLQTAIAYFEEAIAKQPDYAEAYSALGAAQLQYLFIGPHPPGLVIPKAEASARKAIELDPALPRPHQTLGTILTHYYWKWDEGNEQLRMAKQLAAPGGPTGTGGSAPVRNQHEEAIAEALQARQRDPLSINAQIDLAIAYRAASQFDRAVSEFRRALVMEPGRPRIRFQLGVTHVLSGRYDEAIRELEGVTASSGNPRFMAYLGYAYVAAGRRDEARDVLTELVARSRQHYVSSFGIALIHDAFGERELALAALERAYQDHAVELAQMSQYPAFRAIAEDPRYKAVMQRVSP